MWSSTRSLWTSFIRRQYFSTSLPRLKLVACNDTEVRSDETQTDFSEFEDHDEAPPAEVRPATEHRHSQFFKAQRLAEILECDVKEMNAILNEYPKVAHKPLHRLQWTARLLRMRCPVASILRFPSVLAIPWVSVEHRCRILEEIGAQNIETVATIVAFDSFFRTPLFELVRKKVISTPELLGSILSRIEKCPASLPSRLTTLLDAPESFGLSLFAYRRLIIREYLKERLGDTIFPEEKLQMLEKQSIALISARLNILLDDFKIDVETLKSKPTLLLISTYSLLNLMDKCEGSDATSLKKMVIRNPKIVSLGAEQICSKEKSIRLKKATKKKVEEEPDTISAPTPASNVRKNTENRVHREDLFNRLSSDASTARDNQLPKVLRFLIRRLDLDQRPRIKRILTKHPARKFLSVKKCKEGCEYLLKEGVLTLEQIGQNPIVCLWSREVLQRVWESFPVDVYSEALGPDWRKHPDLAEMIVYELESNDLSIHVSRETFSSTQKMKKNSKQTKSSTPGGEDEGDDDGAHEMNENPYLYQNKKVDKRKSGGPVGSENPEIT